MGIFTDPDPGMYNEMIDSRAKIKKIEQEIERLEKERRILLVVLSISVLGLVIAIAFVVARFV